jgi:hypothetical protein
VAAQQQQVGHHACKGDECSEPPGASFQIAAE